MFDNLNWRWIFVLVLVGGTYGLISTTYNQSLTRELQAKGIKATAFQISKQQSGKISNPTYQIEFRYKVPDQGVKVAKIEVPLETFQRIR